MTDSPELSCPECGGREVKDLSSLRRGAGWGLIALAVCALVVLALVPVKAPTWSLVACAAAGLLGLLALFGAQRAKYCPSCDVRLEPKKPGNPPPSSGGD